MKSRKKIAQDEARNALADGDTAAGRYEGRQAVKEAAGEGTKMYPKKEGPKTFEGGAHRAEMKHAKDGSEDHLGPKQYDDYGAKGHGAHSKDYGAKMTADPKSYRTSMARHWSGSNSRFLTEGGDVIDQTAQRDSM